MATTRTVLIRRHPNIGDIQGLPSFALAELRQHKAYPHRLPVVDDVELVYRLSPNRSIAASKQAVLRKELFGWIMADGKTVGAIALDAYSLKRCSSNKKLVWVMDDEGRHEYELAVTLAGAWNNVRLEVANRGPILDLQAAWIWGTHSERQLLRTSVRAILNKVFRNYSIIVLKAEPQGITDTLKVERRRAAMKRYYSEIIGVAPFAGEPGEEGWMWAPNPAQGTMFPRIYDASGGLIR